MVIGTQILHIKSENDSQLHVQRYNNNFILTNLYKIIFIKTIRFNLLIFHLNIFVLE